MISQSELISRILDLERAIAEVQIAITQLNPGSGNMGSVKQPIQDGPHIGRPSDFLRHGNYAQDGFEVDKFCVRFGPEKGATGIDQVQKTGQLGMVLGNNGESVSKWDSV